MIIVVDYSWYVNAHKLYRTENNQIILLNVENKIMHSLYYFIDLKIPNLIIKIEKIELYFINTEI